MQQEYRIQKHNKCIQQRVYKVIREQCKQIYPKLIQQYLQINLQNKQQLTINDEVYGYRQLFNIISEKYQNMQILQNEIQKQRNNYQLNCNKYKSQISKLNHKISNLKEYLSLSQDHCKAIQNNLQSKQQQYHNLITQFQSLHSINQTQSNLISTFKQQIQNKQFSIDNITKNNLKLNLLIQQYQINIDKLRQNIAIIYHDREVQINQYLRTIDQFKLHANSSQLALKSSQFKCQQIKEDKQKILTQYNNLKAIYQVLWEDYCLAEKYCADILSESRQHLEGLSLVEMIRNITINRQNIVIQCKELKSQIQVKQAQLKSKISLNENLQKDIKNMRLELQQLQQEKGKLKFELESMKKALTINKQDFRDKLILINRLKTQKINLHNNLASKVKQLEEQLKQKDIRIHCYCNQMQQQSSTTINSDNIYQLEKQEGIAKVEFQKEHQKTQQLGTEENETINKTIIMMLKTQQNEAQDHTQGICTLQMSVQTNQKETVEKQCQCSLFSGSIKTRQNISYIQTSKQSCIHKQVLMSKADKQQCDPQRSEQSNHIKNLNSIINYIINYLKGYTPKGIRQNSWLQQQLTNRGQIYKQKVFASHNWNTKMKNLQFIKLLTSRQTQCKQLIADFQRIANYYLIPSNPITKFNNHVLSNRSQTYIKPPSHKYWQNDEKFSCSMIHCRQAQRIIE